MEEDLDEKPSLFRRLEEWWVERDLHIWYGGLTAIALVVLVYMIYTETDRNEILRRQVLLSNQTIVSKDREITSLNAEIEYQKAILPPLTEIGKPVQDTVEKGAKKLGDKINQVQDALITSNTQDVKIITKTETQTVEKPIVIPVDNELKNMMQQSFCASNPEGKSCKGNKK